MFDHPTYTTHTQIDSLLLQTRLWGVDCYAHPDGSSGTAQTLMTVSALPQLI